MDKTATFAFTEMTNGNGGQVLAC